MHSASRLVGLILLLAAAAMQVLQQDNPDDYVVATGETHSVQEFVEETFAHLDMDWNKFVATDPRYLRPAEVDLLVGDPSKAKRQLGWEPKVKLDEGLEKTIAWFKTVSLDDFRAPTPNY